MVDEMDFYEDNNIDDVVLSAPTAETTVISSPSLSAEEKGTASKISAPTVDNPKSNIGEENSKDMEDAIDQMFSGIPSEEDAKPKSIDFGGMSFGSMQMEAEDEDEDESFSPEERLSAKADRILSACLKPDKDPDGVYRHAIDTMSMLPSPSIFRDENFVLFTVLYNYRGRLRFINIDEEFIKLYLNRNRKILINNKDMIDINAYGEVDGSAELGYIGGVLKHYRRLLTLEDLSTDEFDTELEKYKIEFKAIEAEKAYRQSLQILKDGVTIRHKKWFGYEDSQLYLKRKLAEIDSLVTMAAGTGYTSHRDLILKPKIGKKPVLIGDYGGIKELNDVYGGIYTGFFIQIIAPPKAGKSKFCARLVHTMIVKYGTNVTVWAKEGGNEAFNAQLRAIHFDYLYNKGADMKDKKYGVSQEAIINDRYPSDELRQLEKSSSIDLATNENYGTVDYIDTPFESETFLDSVDTSVKSNKSMAVVIDYLQIIGSHGNLSERERVSDAYIRALSYCKSNNIAFISPAQYKQDTFDKLMELKNTNEADMRTSGGVTSEVVRTPDIIFAFWATTEDLRNNRMKILSMPGRFSKPFPEIDVVLNLEVCQFMSKNKDGG